MSESIIDYAMRAQDRRNGLDPDALEGRRQPLAAHGEIGNGRGDESRGTVRTSTRGETQSYLLRRQAREVLLEVLAEVDLPADGRQRLLAALRRRGVG